MVKMKNVIHWLQICSTEHHAEQCKQCPYNKDNYEYGCGKLLQDAALLLSLFCKEECK